MIAKKIICFLAVIIVVFSSNISCALKNTSRPLVNTPNIIEWPDSQLKEMFKEYWSYRSRGDAINVLKLEAPYVKAMIDIERYSEFIEIGKKNKWNAVRIEKIEWVNQNLIMIGFTAEVKEEPVRAREVYYLDRWVLMNEKWYHAFDDPIINPDNDFGQNP